MVAISRKQILEMDESGQAGFLSEVLQSDLLVETGSSKCTITDETNALKLKFASEIEQEQNHNSSKEQHEVVKSNEQATGGILSPLAFESAEQDHSSCPVTPDAETVISMEDVGVFINSTLKVVEESTEVFVSMISSPSKEALEPEVKPDKCLKSDLVSQEQAVRACEGRKGNTEIKSGFDKLSPKSLDAAASTEINQSNLLLNPSPGRNDDFSTYDGGIEFPIGASTYMRRKARHLSKMASISAKTKDTSSTAVEEESSTSSIVGSGSAGQTETKTNSSITTFLFAFRGGELVEMEKEECNDTIDLHCEGNKDEDTEEWTTLSFYEDLSTHSKKAANRTIPSSDFVYEDKPGNNANKSTFKALGSCYVEDNDAGALFGGRFDDFGARFGKCSIIESVGCSSSIGKDRRTMLPEHVCNKLFPLDIYVSDDDNSVVFPEEDESLHFSLDK